MFKRSIAFLAAIILSFTLTACGESGNGKAESSSATSSDSKSSAEKTPDSEAEAPKEDTPVNSGIPEIGPEYNGDPAEYMPDVDQSLCGTWSYHVDSETGEGVELGFRSPEHIETAVSILESAGYTNIVPELDNLQYAYADDHCDFYYASGTAEFGKCKTTWGYEDSAEDPRRGVSIGAANDYIGSPSEEAYRRGCS